MKENRKLAVWTLICTLCAGMLTGCGFFGKGFNNLSGQNAWKKTLKAYQAFLEDKVPDNEIYGDMIFPDKSGNLMLAVLYVDDARNGFDNPHFDLFGYEDGEVKRIEAFDPEEDAEENGGKILDTIFTDGIIRVRECDRDGYFSTVYYQIDQNEPVPFYTTHYMDTDQYYEVTIGNGKGAETFLVGSDRNDENRYPDEYDQAMEDLYKEIYDGRYAWDDFAKYMRDEVYYIPNYSHVIAFLDDEGVYDFEGHGDAWFSEMDENGVLTDFEKDMSGYLINEGPMDATAFLVCLYNNSRVYREYGSDGIFRFATMILARDAELLDQLTYARSDEEELVHALLYYELKFGSKDALEKRKLYRDMTDREVENAMYEMYSDKSVEKLDEKSIEHELAVMYAAERNAILDETSKEDMIEAAFDYEAMIRHERKAVIKQMQERGDRTTPEEYRQMTEEWLSSKDSIVPDEGKPYAAIRINDKLRILCDCGYRENPIIPEDYVLGFDDGKVSATSYFGERCFDRFLTATGYITCTRSGGAFEYERALLNLDTLTEEGVSVSMEFEPTVYSIAGKDVSEAEATQYVIDKVGDGFSFDDEIPAIDGVAFDQLYWSDDIADAIENAYVIKTDR